MSTYVIVHGAWAGAWAWSRVAHQLLAKDHRVHVPSLSGLGERRHLARFPIALSDHVADVANEIELHDLERVVLVMHSYGGLVGAAAAERVRRRIGKLVFVDALVPSDGKRFIDYIPVAVDHDPVPPPPVSQGAYANERDRAWVEAMATPQPRATFTDRVELTGDYLSIGSKTFIASTGPDGFADYADQFRGDDAWTVREIDSGHDVPVENPQGLAALLHDLA